MSHIRLTAARFLAEQPEQASDDGDRALAMAQPFASAMVRVRLRELLVDSEPYAGLPRVATFRERLRSALAA